jgi:hypothetical protein
VAEGGDGQNGEGCALIFCIIVVLTEAWLR